MTGVLKRILIGLIALVVIGLAGFVVFAWWPAIAPVPPPAAASFAPTLVARGEVLAGAGYCATCHTAKGGALYAGGSPMVTGFGTIYSTNIIPDPETGIGSWSEAAFRRAMQEGVARDGSHLFPAFPYDHFTKLTDEDVAALYAFLMTRTPVSAPAHENTIPFPLNIRALQAGWKLLFFRPGRFEPDPARGADWNRGAYLAEGISHCGACHTPRRSSCWARISGSIPIPSHPSTNGWLAR
jgi:mono/diheme cytochrome c family protein